MTNEIITNTLLQLLWSFVVIGSIAGFIWVILEYHESQKPQTLTLEREKFYTSCPKCFWATAATSPELSLKAFQDHYAVHEQKPDPKTCEHKTIFTEWEEGPYDLQLKYEIAVCSTCHTIVNRKERNK